MIRAGRVDAALLSASEVDADPDGRPEALRGIVETGSALLLERAPAGSGFGRFHARTFPEHAGALRVHANGAAGGALVVARDPRLEALYLRAIPPVVEELLAFEGLPMSRIAVVLPPQISPAFVRGVADRLGVDPTRCVDATVAGADLFTSSLPHAFRSTMEARRVAPGDFGLVIAVGSGVQVVCALYRF
jgi:3-oxoacyl-[acyl-carrier-protein] synthase III